MREFRDDALAFCRFVDSWRVNAVPQPFTTLLRLLSALAKSAISIPTVLVEKECAESCRIDHEAWTIIAADLRDLTESAAARLMQEYEGDLDAQVRASMLWDDLADIYRDLRDSLDLYALGGPEQIAEAVWQWRFGYESHWGAHLMRALLTVYEIKFRVYVD